MAAEESSQGAALGPEFSDPTGGEPPARGDIPDLHDVLGELMEALCVVQVVSYTLQELMEESSEEIGYCAIALRHGFQMLDAVYCRFDLGLLGYDGPGGDDPDDDPDEDDVGGERHALGDSAQRRDASATPQAGNRGSLALVA